MSAASGEYDFALPKKINDRHNHVMSLAKELLDGSLRDIKALKVTAVPTPHTDGRSATFSIRFCPEESIDFARWSLKLADLMFNARSLLDNVMWFITHDRPVGVLTKKQESQLYFPFLESEAAWSVFLERPEAVAIRHPLLERLKNSQPFMNLGSPTNGGLGLLNALHREDKHRVPISLEVMIDAQWPAEIGLFPADGQAFEWWIDWLGTQTPIYDGMPIARVRLDRAIAPPVAVPIAVVPTAEIGATHLDLQNLVWDIVGSVTRVIDNVCLGATHRSDLVDGDVAYRRAQLAAFNRSIVDGTDEWEKNFNHPSEYEILIRELDEAQPSLEAFYGNRSPETPSIEDQRRRST